MKYRVNRVDTGSKAHKFNAQRTELDGHSFASKAEARRYAELKLLEKAGQIRGLVLQPKYPLYAYAATATGFVSTVIGHYIADFSYLDRDNQQVVEDVKGMRTAVYRLKKKHFEVQHGMSITEIGRATPATKAKRARSTRRSETPK